jgi:hypothetical protein
VRRRPSSCSTKVSLGEASTLRRRHGLALLA